VKGEKYLEEYDFKEFDIFDITVKNNDPTVSQADNKECQ
jgi:hypothetical protein